MANARKAPVKEPGAKEEPLRPTEVHLVDRNAVSQLQFIARETRTRMGKVVAIKSGVAHVKLSENAGQIALWGKGDFAAAMITAEGYRACNTVAQLSLLKPRSIELDGVGKVPNPFTKHDANDCFLSGWLRLGAAGPGPTGNFVVTDKTTFISLREYLREDLIGVARQFPAAAFWGVKDVGPAKILGKEIDRANADIEKRAADGQTWLRKYKATPADIALAKEKVADGLWKFFDVDITEGQGIWYDRTSDAVRRVFSTYSQSGKFGVRKLEAIAYRNAMRDHPLMPAMHIDPDKVNTEWEKQPEGSRERPRVLDRWVMVPVFFHEQVEDQEAIEAVLDDFDKGIRTAAYSVAKPEESGRVHHATREDEAGTDPRDGEERHRQVEREPGDDGESIDDRGGEDERQPEEREAQPRRGAPAPDPIAVLVSKIATATDAAGKDIVAKLLPLFPGVQADPTKASMAELEAYLKALDAQITKRDYEAEQAKRAQRRTGR